MEATEFDCAQILLGQDVEADISHLNSVACLAGEAPPRLHSLAALTKASLANSSSELRLAAAKALSGLSGNVVLMIDHICANAANRRAERPLAACGARPVVWGARAAPRVYAG